MKILMINSFYYLRGGSERCFFDLTKLLEDHGHEVIPFSMHHPQNLLSPYADYFIPYVDFPSLMGNGLQGKLQAASRVIYYREARRRIERLIAATRPNLAHVHGIAHETSPSILPALKAAGIPVVQTLHDYKLLCPNTNFVSHGEICERCKGHNFHNVVRHRCKRDSLPASLLAGIEMTVHQLTRIYARNVDAFIAPSQFLADKVAEYGIANPVVTIPNFVDGHAFEPWYEPDDYFVYIGRLSPVKGVKTLLEAMRSVGRSHLKIAGTGELEDELRAYVAAHGLTNVTFLGHLPLDELVPLLQRARFSVVPSEWYENYPMSVLESLACGTPVIGAAIGGIPESVIHGETGLLFESKDAAALAAAINQLLDRPDRAQAMGRKGRERVMTVNRPGAHYAATMALYTQVTNPTGADAQVTGRPAIESERI